MKLERFWKKANFTHKKTNRRGGKETEQNQSSRRWEKEAKMIKRAQEKSQTKTERKRCGKEQHCVNIRQILEWGLLCLFPFLPNRSSRFSPVHARVLPSLLTPTWWTDCDRDETQTSCFLLFLFVCFSVNISVNILSLMKMISQHLLFSLLTKS